MYLLLKASKVNVKNHPVLKRLYQYRQLISQLEPIYNEIIRPQLEVMIEMVSYQPFRFTRNLFLNLIGRTDRKW